MNGRKICRVLGSFFLYFSFVLLLPLAIAAGYEWFSSSERHPQTHSTLAFAITFALSISIALGCRRLGRKNFAPLQRRESILLVVIIWFLTAGISGLPFLLSGTLSHPIDAYFESMSGLTTTGSSVLCAKAYHPETFEEIPHTLFHPKDNAALSSYYGNVSPVIHPQHPERVYSGIEALGKALLFWRSFLQLLGGMGIILLFIAVLPALSMGGRFLFQAEAPGPIKESLTPRIRETAAALWKIYLGFTGLQIVLLLATNRDMPLFDAVTLSLSTISTGGFSVRNDSIAAYHSIATESIVMAFMLLGSVNFSLYFYCLRGKFYRLFDPEFLCFMMTIVGGSLLLALTLWWQADLPFWHALRLGSFQALSAQTTTGYAISHYEFWPFSSQFLLVLLLFVGGMSGSTTGSIKIARFMVLFKSIRLKIDSLFRPDAIRCLKIGDRPIDDKTAVTVFTVFVLIIFFTALGAFLLILDGLDPHLALSTSISMLNNTGLIFGGTGSPQSFAFLSTFSKVVCILWMALGRLEFFALLVLLFPSFWKNR